MKTEDLPPVSIVVIGKNEADNLDATFTAVRQIDYPAEKIESIYVDTGSTDNSVEIALKYTPSVFIEKSCWPTPGLARNRGLLEASHDILHFIDGDIQIHRDYLKTAVKKLAEPGIQAVYGFLEEKSTQGVNRVLLSHWQRKKPGYSQATGGGGTYEKKALLAVDGYDERIRKGQETDLGERFREAGCRIWLLDTVMGTHDYGVASIADYFKIQVIDGKSKSYNMLLNKNGIFFSNNKKRAVNNLIFNTGMIFFIGIVFFLKQYLLLLAVPAAWLFFYPLLKVVTRQIRSKDRIIYLCLTNISRPFIFWGQITLFLGYVFQSKTGKKKFIREKAVLSEMKGKL